MPLVSRDKRVAEILNLINRCSYFDNIEDMKEDDPTLYVELKDYPVQIQQLYLEADIRAIELLSCNTFDQFIHSDNFDWCIKKGFLVYNYLVEGLKGRRRLQDTSSIALIKMNKPGSFFALLSGQYDHVGKRFKECLKSFEDVSIDVEILVTKPRGYTTAYRVKEIIYEMQKEIGQPEVKFATGMAYYFKKSRYKHVKEIMRGQKNVIR